MNIAYVSNLISRKRFSELFSFGTSTPGQQVQKYNRLLAQGLSMQPETRVTNVSRAPVSRANTSKVFIKSRKETADGLNFIELGIINLPVIKDFRVLLGAGRAVVSGNYDAVICDLLSLSASYGAIKAAKKLSKKGKKVPVVGIITDLPQFLDRKTGAKPFLKLFGKCTELCDAFIIMTGQMRLVTDGKPCCVIEGMCDIRDKAEFSADAEKLPGRVCVYAGGLESAYNVDKLCRAFANISETVPELSESELRLYGNGALREFIINFSKDHPSVKYMGTVPNGEVLSAEKKAFLLINPRGPEGEFTKYSFPSKNLEYMASGTPMLAYMLPGIPENYKGLFLEFNGDFENSLKEALLTDKKTLEFFGKKARTFVFEEKNNFQRAGDVLKMLQELKNE